MGDVREYVFNIGQIAYTEKSIDIPEEIAVDEQTFLQYHPVSYFTNKYVEIGFYMLPHSHTVIGPINEIVSIGQTDNNNFYDMVKQSRDNFVIPPLK
jgi:hypothetical protein